MNTHSHSYDAWYPGEGGTPSAFTGRPDLVLHPRSWARFVDRLVVVVSARDLAGLAGGPDAAIRLGSTRGYLADSAENRRMAEMLRTRPWDFGAAGAPLLLGAKTLLPRADGGIELSGVECIKGFQRLVVLAHVSCEVPEAHLDHADVRVEIVTGADRARSRRLTEEAAEYSNAVHPQDRLSRCPHLKRISEEFRAEGGFFDWRRGVVSGPHPCGYTMEDVTRALACTSGSPWPTLTHKVSTLEGLHALWADVDGPEYRSLIHEDVHAFSVQRAVEAREVALKVVKRLCGSSPVGHERLLQYAPELVAWAACRKLPLDELHRSDRRAKDWSGEVHGPFADIVAGVARDLVERYRQVRMDSKVFVHEAGRLDVWLDVLEPSRIHRRA